MGFSLDVSIPAFTVFIQGLLSFFSPCVLPLVPLYISYLAGGTKTVDSQGRIVYSRKKVMVNTVFFVVGVSFAFFLLGFGFTAAGRFFGGNRVLFARIGGSLVILFGLCQIGFFGGDIFKKEHHLPFRLERFAMNGLVALIMGFTFSFAWTPCVGPALASVLIMASSAATAGTGFLLIGVYTLGFVIMFLAVGLFTGSLLDFFKKHQKVVRYTVKAGGVLMVLMGVMMWTGWMNGITGYLSRFGAADGGRRPGVEGPGQPGGTADPGESVDSGQGADGAEAGSWEPGSPEPGREQPGDGAAENTDPSQTAGGEESQTSAEAAKEDKVAAPDFTLTDQYGETHKLSDYKGKTVFLNFWATWCGPCRTEMPDIQALYESYGSNEKDLVILGVANPAAKEYPNNQDVSQEEVEKFLEDGGYTYPVVMDITGEAFSNYYVTAFPTTFMIDRDGNVKGYVTGTLTKDMMEEIIKVTMDEAAGAEAKE